MDTRQIEYILQIAEENNITKAAEKLFITQSALNQQLLKLERELGTPLFQRTKNKWCLTDAGRIYVEGARKMMQIKKDTYNQLYDVSLLRKGLLNIGLCPGRGLDMFTAIYPELHRSMPNLTIRPLEMRVAPQQAAIAAGDLDVGFQVLSRSDWQKNQYWERRTDRHHPGRPPGGAKSCPTGRTPGHTGFKRDPLRALCTDGPQFHAAQPL